MNRRALATVLALAISAAFAASRTVAVEPPPASAPETHPFGELKFRYIGPEGNRVSAVAGVPGDPSVIYAGAASGGLFKSSDGGAHWQAIFDDQPVSSIGALAVAPSDPNVVWAGTGEPFIRSHISVGWGVFKSTDAGKSWTKMGLDQTGRIARVLVHPKDPDIVLVCALGHSYGPQPERGVFRSTDGGKTWTKVLFVDDHTGCSDLVMDPNNPRILFAGMWQLEIHTWGRESGGPGSGLYRSTDLGASWKAVEGSGLPSKPFGKVGLAMSAANSNRVYALIETGGGVQFHGKETDSGRLWRSDDGGASWELVSSDQIVAGRTHYYNRMGVEPDNADEVYFLTSNWAKTIDGGKTVVDLPPAEIAGGDHHDIWIDPTNGSRILAAHDGGVSISVNRGHTWRRIQLPIAQMYHVTVDDRIPYYVYGNRQDGPSARGPSNSKLAGPPGIPMIPRALWTSVGGGESGWATPDPGDPNGVWSSASGFGSVGGIVTHYDLRTNSTHTVEVWPQATIGSAAADLKYRFVWTFPLTISPHDHNRVYVGSQFVHETTDGGNTWQVISPDLTLNDKSHQQLSGGLTPDNIGVEYAGVLFSIAESPLQAGLIWVGSNDGLVHVTRDHGKSWTDVTKSLPGLPPLGTISTIEPSHFDASSAYLVADLHQVNNREPWVFKTADLGKTWVRITDGLPHTPLSYAHVVREDPTKRGLLYLGLENGLWVSLDDGRKWMPLQNNLPPAPVYDLAVQRRFGDLAVATYGRGFWILDDLSLMRQYTPATAQKDAELFIPRPSYRFRGVEGAFTPDDDPVDGFNPPDGVAIHYYLKNLVRQKDKETGKEKEEVTFSVADASGKVVRTFTASGKPGFHRAYWNLNYDKTKEARLRTSPLLAPSIKVGLEGIAAPGVGRFELLAPPGTYTLKLKVGDHELTQPLTVLKDPNSGSSEEGLQQQTPLATELADDLNRVVDAINAAETVRGQLVFLRGLLPPEGDHKDMREAAEALDKKIVGVEETLFQMHITGRGQDQIRWPFRLAEQTLYLAGQVTDSDFPPTAAQREVHQILHDQISAAIGKWNDLLAKDVGEFNAKLNEKHLTGIVAKP